MKPFPSRERVLKLLRYDPATGDFFWRARTLGHNRVGRKAGGIGKDGYWVIGMDRFRYQAHSLVWLVETGKWPVRRLDHIDRSQTNNEKTNLRLSTRSQNAANANLSAKNTSGYKGVSWDKVAGGWKVQICVFGKRIYLGLEKDKLKAAAIYDAAAKKYFKKFAATNSDIL